MAVRLGTVRHTLCHVFYQTMVNVRPHFDSDDHQPGHPSGGEAAGGGGGNDGGGRLNLLLSYAGWQAAPWIDTLPRLLEPMGIVSHRAQTGREASKLIEQTRIHIAVVDLGLPLDRADSDCHASEGGPRLLELLSRLAVPPPTVIVKRSLSHRDDCREISAALRLGAFAVVDRPRVVDDLNVLLDVLRRCLARHYDGQWPG